MHSLRIFQSGQTNSAAEVYGIMVRTRPIVRLPLLWQQASSVEQVSWA